MLSVRVAVAVAGMTVFALTGCTHGRSGAFSAPESTSPFDVPVISETPAAGTPAPTPMAKPVVLHGVGDDVVRVHIPGGGPGIVSAHSSGQPGLFAILARGTGSDDAGQGDLLVDFADGSYSGSTPVDFGDSHTTSLVIKATGPWTIRISDARAAPSFTTSVSGRGDKVLIYQGNGTVAALTKSGGVGLFAVRTWSDADVGTAGNLVADDVGDFRGNEPWAPGPMWVVVSADGAWKIATS